jgi:hypothetical protein
MELILVQAKNVSITGRAGKSEYVNLEFEADPDDIIDQLEPEQIARYQEINQVIYAIGSKRIVNLFGEEILDQFSAGELKDYLGDQ